MSLCSGAIELGVPDRGVHESRENKISKQQIPFKDEQKINSKIHRAKIVGRVMVICVKLDNFGSTIRIKTLETVDATTFIVNINS